MKVNQRLPRSPHTKGFFQIYTFPLQEWRSFRIFVDELQRTGVCKQKFNPSKVSVGELQRPESQQDSKEMLPRMHFWMVWFDGRFLTSLKSSWKLRLLSRPQTVCGLGVGEGPRSKNILQLLLRSDVSAFMDAAFTFIQRTDT